MTNTDKKLDKASEVISNQAYFDTDKIDLIENNEIDLNDYDLYLKNKRNDLLKAKKHEEKLSSSIESYILEDAKVCHKRKLQNYYLLFHN